MIAVLSRDPIVVPAKAGTQGKRDAASDALALDPGFRRDDDPR